MNKEVQHHLAKHQRSLHRQLSAVGLILFILLPSLAQALEFRCELNGDVRQLSVVIPGVEHLCEVSVDYETTGERKVMWHADNDSMFCSAKAYELIGKYENQWGFTCAKWPDRDGIDELSPTQRSIVDLQLRKRLTADEDEQDFRAPIIVTGVKATASTPLDHEPGTIAVQYFLSDGSDETEIIVDSGNSYKVFATIGNLASQITGEGPVETALISSITDGGALEIVTTLASEGEQRDCYGKQVLMADTNARLIPRTPHRVICQKHVTLNSASD